MIDTTVAKHLLGLVDKLPESKQAIERQLDFPQGWLSQAKNGAGSVKKWSALKEFLATRFSREELEAAGEHVASETALADMVGGVRTQEQREEAERQLAVAILKGEVDRMRGELVLDALKQLGATMEKAAEERGQRQIAAIEVLTEEESVALEALRERRAGPALQGSESVVRPQ